MLLLFSIASREFRDDSEIITAAETTCVVMMTVSLKV